MMPNNGNCIGGRACALQTMRYARNRLNHSDEVVAHPAEDDAVWACP